MTRDTRDTKERMDYLPGEIIRATYHSPSVHGGTITDRFVVKKTTPLKIICENGTRLSRTYDVDRQWQRCRFVVDAEDYRPVTWPPPGPYWCSGYDRGEGRAILIAYTRRGVSVFRYWPKAEEVECENAAEVQFSERFPEPDWWRELQAGEGTSDEANASEANASEANASEANASEANASEPLDVPALLDEVERLKGCVEEARQQGREAGRREGLEEAAQLFDEVATKMEAARAKTMGAEWVRMTGAGHHREIAALLRQIARHPTKP